MATVSLISRLGWKRAGTRFNTRGVDDDGNCANFVEVPIPNVPLTSSAADFVSRRNQSSARTSTAIVTYKCGVAFHVCTFLGSIHSLFCSHCCAFGSYLLPPPSLLVFWEQQGLQTFGQRIQITRPQASQPAFDRHFAGLVEEYGAVHAINLLGTKENEAILTAAYARHMRIMQNSVGDIINITNFDFHTAVKYGGHESVIREVRLVSGPFLHSARCVYCASCCAAEA